MQVALVAAMAQNRVIGYQGKMPWHLPAELQYFKAITMGKPIIMGRKTFESIGRPLPGRTNIVLTRNPHALPEGVLVADSVSNALEIARQHLDVQQPENDEVMVIGGGEIYAAFLPQATRLYLTHIDLAVDGDTWFPDWSEMQWEQTLLREHQADSQNPLSFRGYRYERKN